MIGPFVTIAGCVMIGDRCTIGPCSVIGTPPQHKDKPIDYGNVVIGNDVTIRENVSIHAALAPGNSTVIGDGCYIMSQSHVGHDCVIEEKVMIAIAKLAGHTRVMRTANIGLNATTHQFTTIGTGAMIGAGAVVVKDVIPYAKVVGNPAKWLGVNTYLRKNVTGQFVFDELKRFNEMRSKERNVINVPDGWDAVLYGISGGVEIIAKKWRYTRL